MVLKSLRPEFCRRATAYPKPFPLRGPEKRLRPGETRAGSSNPGSAEERSAERARQAATVAGLRTSPTSGLTVALNVMQQSAQEARQRAEAMNMKAEALSHLKDATADQNVAAALAEVRGTAPTKHLSERLSALRR
jgi:hypothetical protein